MTDARLTTSRYPAKKKLEIGDKIEIAGHIISHKGIKPDPSKFLAIRDFPAPKNIKEFRSYMGLSNQLSSFLPDNNEHPTCASF